MELGQSPSPLLYVIGDRGVFRRDDDWLNRLEEVANILLRYKQTALQVRVQGSSEHSQFNRMSMAREKLAPAMRLGLRVLLNGTMDQAKKLDFRGVHLKEALLDENFERPRDMEIATSTHSLNSIQRSKAIGAAFCVFSPIFKPLSKNLAPVGVESLQSMVQQTEIDIIALGGITPERVGPCIQAGAKGVACISSVMRSKNPRQSIQSLIKAAQKA